MNKYKSPLELLDQVVDAGNVLYRAAFMSGAQYPEVDYLSLYTRTEQENEHLNHTMQHLGQFVAEKNGKVFRLNDRGLLPTDIVRVCDVKPDDTLVGGVDFVVPEGRYPEIEAQLVGSKGYFHELKPDEEYQVCGLRDEGISVSIAFASKRITQKVMGITPIE